MISPVVYWRNKKTAFLFLNKIGKLVSFTKINNPPQGFGKHPYWVGIIEFDDGVRKTGQLVLEGKMPQVGVSVKGVIRKTRKVEPQEVISYGVKFKLL